MIVVDTNIIAALILPTSGLSEAAVKALDLDREWVAPLLWRSEFRNILATAVKTQRLTQQQALEAMETAEQLMEGGGYTLPSVEILEIAVQMECTAYDSEFAALAENLSVKLVTLDEQLLRAFPDFAVSLTDFVG